MLSSAETESKSSPPEIEGEMIHSLGTIQRVDFSQLCVGQLDIVRTTRNCALPLSIRA